MHHSMTLIPPFCFLLQVDNLAAHVFATLFGD
jgi:hypothetical protein